VTYGTGREERIRVREDEEEEEVIHGEKVLERQRIGCHIRQEAYP
jgi:hypothetical protein